MKKLLGKNGLLNSPFILKTLDLANTILANPIVAGGLFALATIPIEDWWTSTHEATPWGIKNPISGLREIMIGATAAHAAAGAIPAIAKLAEGRSSVAKGGILDIPGLPYP